MGDDRDLGLGTLRAIRSDLGADIDEELLEGCFEIQKRYQFEHDRTLSVKAMERLIDKHVDRIATKGEDGCVK